MTSGSFQNLHGLLAVNKPIGMVSKDVSRWLTKRFGKLKLGHVGTLDPSAEGVLPILLGRATRLQDFLLSLPKTYEFDMTLGSETDTLDSEGEVIREAPWEHVTIAGLQAAAREFVGEFDQTPPLYSAVKYKGKPLYEYARSQRAEDVPLADLKRRVSVSSFEVLGYANGVGRLRITCSRGTYVRVLVKDVAEKLASCGTLTRLVRTAAAGVAIADSHALEHIEENVADFSSLVVPMGKIDLGMPRWRATKPWCNKLRAGQTLSVSVAEFAAGVESELKEAMPGGWARPVVLLDDAGDAFGMGTVRGQESGRIVITMRRGL